MSSDIRGQFLQLLLLAFSIIPVTVFPSLEAREELIDQLKKLMDQVMVKEPFYTDIRSLIGKVIS